MLYYDDRDYYNSDNIDELYDDEYLFEEKDDENISEIKHSWEFDYHSLASELEEDY